MANLTTTDLDNGKTDLETLSTIVNSQTESTTSTRLGDTIKTVKGLTDEFEQAIINSGYQVLGSFASGVTLTAVNQVLDYDGGLYRTTEALPYTTDGATPDLDSGEWVVVSDGVLSGIARSLNALDSEIIYSTDTATILDNVIYIYDASAQVTWGKPSSVGAGETIVSVVGGALTTSGGGYTLNSTEQITSRNGIVSFRSDSFGSAVDNMIAGRVDGMIQVSHQAGNAYSTGGTEWIHTGVTAGTIADFTATSELFTNDFVSSDTEVGRRNAIQEALDLASLNLWSVYSVGRNEIDGMLTIACPYNLNGGVISQNNATSGTIKIQLGSYFQNGIVVTNNSIGIGMEVDGSSQIFIGRVKPTKLFTSILIVGNETNQAVTESKGVGVQLSALDDSSYIAGASGDAQVGLFTDGVKVVASDELAFINSNNFEFGINRCLNHYVSEATLTSNGCNIGPDNHWHLNIQPGNDAGTVLKIFEEGGSFTGALWDLAGIPDVNNAIVLDNSRPPSPNEAKIPTSGNVINMVGASIDKATGPVYANEFTPRANTTNVKAAMSYTQGTGHNYYPRKIRNSVEGVYDTLNYLGSVDNCIAGADKKYILVTTQTNQSGGGGTTVTPAAGYDIKDMFIATNFPTRYEITPGNWLQIAIGFNQGDVPISSILADIVGISGNVGTDIYIDIREAGQSTWTTARYIEGKDNGITYISRFNPFGGSSTQIRPVSIDGIRFRMFNTDGVFEVENIFVMSPTLLGKESVNPNAAEIHDGPLDMGYSPDQGVILQSPDGTRYIIVMKDGGVIAVEPAP